MNIESVIDETNKILDLFIYEDKEIDNKNIRDKYIFKLGINYNMIQKFFKNYTNKEDVISFIQTNNYSKFKTHLCKLKEIYFEQKSKYAI